jgi:hypothetical protein
MSDRAVRIDFRRSGGPVAFGRPVEGTVELDGQRGVVKSKFSGNARPLTDAENELFGAVNIDELRKLAEAPAAPGNAGRYEYIVTIDTACGAPFTLTLREEDGADKLNQRSSGAGNLKDWITRETKTILADGAKTP